MRCDELIRAPMWTLVQFQSTHLHEVWLRLGYLDITYDKFQSTHLHEVWLGMESVPAVELMFQSTHLHEVWLNLVVKRLPPLCFNPHTYMRCDWRASAWRRAKTVSIHTPTWGVTWLDAIVIASTLVSIHTPTWGVTSNADLINFPQEFQSTHLHEVWRNNREIYETGRVFQSTHLHEVWLAAERGNAMYVEFQSTHLHEVWR